MDQIYYCQLTGLNIHSFSIAESAIYIMAKKKKIFY